MKRNHIIETIIDGGLIGPGKYVIAGVSGGPDSLCLLHALSSIADAYDLTIIPVHVNHNLRPEAEDEAAHVEYLCDRMDLECQVFDASCSELAEDLGISTEEAGRVIRYQIFDDVADEISAEGVPNDRIVIAVAHNADDQAETVLFRLLRGTGPHGLAGIPSARISEKGYMIVRPLLNVERRDIEAYIKENRLRPNIDKSNMDSRYARNRIRNELIPYLEENYNPRIRENLRRYADLAYMDDSLLRELAFADLSKALKFDGENDRAEIDIRELKNDPPPVTSRMVSTVFTLLGIEASATYENVTAVMELIYSDHPSAGIDLPYGLRAYREYDKLIFSNGNEAIKPDDSIQIYPQVIMAKDFSADEEQPYAAFDFDLFNEEHPGMLGELKLRTRAEGDYLPMKNGNKKIQDLLVDSKVKKSARDSILMVCIGSEVLWVLPSEHFSGERERSKGRFSPKYHINNTTERVLFIELADAM